MVLEARYKAEKIGYPVIGEKTKENSDVIDYNINEEITTDASAVSNANNNTTTGMATIIPGVNAPKLIQSTSIFSDVQPNVGGVLLSGYKTLSYPNSPSGSLRSWTLSDEFGNIPFKIKTDGSTSLWNGFLIPVSGRYELNVAYPTGSSTFAIDVDIYITKGGYGNDVLLLSHTGVRSSTQFYGNLKYNFSAGDVIFAYENMRYYGDATSFTSEQPWTIQITKL